MKAIKKQIIRPVHRGVKQQKGFTALEVLGVLAVGLMIIAAAGVFIVNMFEGNAVKNLTTEANGTLIDIRKFYSMRPNCTGLNNAVAIANRMVDQNMVNGAAINHAMGGAVTLTCVAINGNANQGIQMQFAGIESGDMCSDIVSTMSRTWDIITIEGANVKAFAGQVDVAAMGNACTAGASRTIVGIAQRV